MMASPATASSGIPQPVTQNSAAATDNFCLRWNDFESNVACSFRELRAESDFFDVTLTCDGDDGQGQGHVLRAHKVVLAACSPFFRSMLRKAALAAGGGHHPNPMIYLRGVRFTDLENILDFIYHGEVNVTQDDLNSFLSVAEDLQIKGLTEPTTAPNAKVNSRVRGNADPGAVPPSKKFKRAQVNNESVANDVKAEPQEETSASTSRIDAEVNEEAIYAEEYDNNDEASKEWTVMVRSYIEQDKENDTYKCLACGRDDFKARINAENHVEAKHVQTPGFVCAFCEKMFKTRNSLRVHKQLFHKNEIK